MSKNVALTLGIISFLLSGIPYFGFIFALIILILTILSIKKEKAGKKTAALVLSILAFVGGIIWTVSITALTKSTVDVVKKEVAKQEKQAAVDKKEAAKTYAINDVVKAKTVEVSVTGVETKEMVGNEYVNKSVSDGGIFVAVNYTLKNVGDKPVNSFSLPTINLVDDKGTKYDFDLDASSNYAMEKGTDNTKALSDLNPGISVSGSHVFEVSKELYESGNWYALINGVQKVSIK